MKKDNRNLIWIWYFACIIPIVQAFIVIKNKNLNGFCEGVNPKHSKGMFCDWGPSLGAIIFGEAHSYWGFAILLLSIGVLGIVFGAFIAREN